MKRSWQMTFTVMGMAVVTAVIATSAFAAAHGSRLQVDPPSQRASGSAVGIKPVADLRQLMIGMFYPESNVVFAAQDDLSTFKQAEDAATSPNPLTSIYPGWEAVEDAAISLEDAANLLLVPGRMCSNGVPVPLNRPDWDQFVQILRSGAQTAYKAAETKSQDAMLTASDTLTRACDACHAAYRDKYQKQGRSKVCMP